MEQACCYQAAMHLESLERRSLEGRVETVTIDPLRSGCRMLPLTLRHAVHQRTALTTVPDPYFAPAGTW